MPDSESSTSVFRCQFRDGAVKVSDLPLEMLALAFCTVIGGRLVKYSGFVRIGVAIAVLMC